MEANCLTTQKALAAGTDPQQFRIEVDPRSRMFDGANPDRPPMPPDDPTSHRYMQCVDGKKGAKYYRNAPRTNIVENPAWKSYLPRDEQGRVVLNTSDAVRMALVNDPGYQSNLEELYLSALDVSFERFRFDAQFFGGSSIFYTSDGKVRSGTGNSSSELVVAPSRPGNRFRVEKLNAMGGEFVVGMANSLVWQFSGPNDYSGTTVLDFSLVQPLLRGAGRIRVLERLTISERALLANVRTMERYRGGYYLNIVTGRDPGQGPSRRGGFFGGAGLEGFSGVGGGGFGRVGGFGFFGFGGGQNFVSGAGAAGAGGYLGLLQQYQQLENQRATVAALRDSVLQLEASYDAGRIDRFQVDLARQALYNTQSQLLSNEALYQATLDNFKITMGLPPDIEVVIRDDTLDRFKLLDRDLTKLQLSASETAEKLREQPSPSGGGQGEGEANLALLPHPGPLPEGEGVAQPAEIVPTPQPTPDDLRLLAQAKQAQREGADWLVTLTRDREGLTQVLPSRRKHLQQIGARPEVAEAQINPLLFSPEQLDKRVAGLDKDIAEFTRRFEKLSTELAELTKIVHSLSKSERDQLGRLTKEYSSQLLELSILLARVRLDAIDIEPTELSSEDALAIASNFRLDWMNARASLVDSWRLIHFNANDLRSNLDVVFTGDIANTGQNPFNLNHENGRLRVGLQFDAPLTRLAERNVYRQSLIEYQQARRSYYRFIDRTYQVLRQTLRQIRLNEINFEIRREAVLVAIAQVDITQLRLSEPPKPEVEPEFGATTARDLVQALGDLLVAQNDFLSVWVNNEVQRFNLEFDLGLMQLDSQGLYQPLGIPLAEIVAEVHRAGPVCEPEPVLVETVGPELQMPPQ